MQFIAHIQIRVACLLFVQVVQIINTFCSTWVGAWTTDTRWLNPKFFAVQIQVTIPNKYLGFGYKGLGFFKDNG